MYYSKCCQNCVLNHDCLFQKNDDVESCGDYQDEEIEKNDEDNPKK